MLPLIDTHVHLFAGRDDGPATLADALLMCRMLVAEGAGAATALAHQNDFYPDNSAPILREANLTLQAALKAEGIPLAVYATGEVMLVPDIVAQYQADHFLSVADQRQFLLVEMPHNGFVDVLPIAAAFAPLGIRLMIAHAERYPELLYNISLGERWIRAGCVIQFTASEMADPQTPTDGRMMKQWATRGMVHLLGSDGHNLSYREPRLRAGVQTLLKWVGPQAVDRIGHLWPSMILEGRPLNLPTPRAVPKPWYARWFGG